MKTLPFAALLAGLLLPGAAGCAAPAPAPRAVVAEPAMAPPEPQPLRVSEVSWKERLEQPYAYLEQRGDYREMGALMRRLLRQARELGLEPAGPPFALFFDDPARTATDQLRSRACLPMAPGSQAPPGFQMDVLPRALVVYARVAGAYPELPRVYPSLFGYLADRGWKQAGPVREIYLVDPGTVQSYCDLESEIQLPWVPAR